MFFNGGDPFEHFGRNKSRNGVRGRDAATCSIATNKLYDSLGVS
jgi:hypothetical protein